MQLFRQIRHLKGSIPNLDFKNKHYKEEDFSPFKGNTYFIIGNPRSGSTFLYQLLSKEKDFIYWSNIHYFFYKNINHFSKIDYLQSLFQNDFKTSNYGYVSGLFAPSELNDFWKFWFDFSLKYKKPKMDYAKLSYLKEKTPKNNQSLVFSWNAHLYYVDYINRLFERPIYLLLFRNEYDIYKSWLKAQDKFGKDWGQEGLMSKETSTVSREDKIIINIIENDILLKGIQESEKYETITLNYNSLIQDLENNWIKINPQNKLKFNPQRNTDNGQYEKFIERYEGLKRAHFENISVQELLERYM